MGAWFFSVSLSTGFRMRLFACIGLRPLHSDIRAQDVDTHKNESGSLSSVLQISMSEEREHCDEIWAQLTKNLLTKSGTERF